MASNLWVVCLAGLLLKVCSAGSCPQPCECPPATLTCRGCPKDYLVLYEDTQLLSITECKYIQYFLKLHRPHLENEERIKYALHKLEITGSFMEKMPDRYINEDFAIQSMNFSNNLIQSIDAGLVANNLTHLDLSHNRLSYIGDRTFEHMVNMLYLDLSANTVTNISVECFVGLYKLVHLDISQNNLTNIMDAMFLPLVSLQQLNISYNMIEALSEKCFSNLLMLQQLDISYNRLMSVAPGTLQFLPNLARLLLADNPELKPDAQIFVGTGRRLQQVDASRTGLRRVPEALTHSVRFLSLAGNRISTLRCGDLDGYPLLHMLDFGDNIIEFVEDDALGRLEMISTLFLNKNKLRSVPKMLPDKLSYLSMDKNLIENLTIIDFATLTNLKILILSNNLISFIQENAFAQLISLEILDVSNNPIKLLTPNTFSGPTRLRKIYMSSVNTSPPAKDISFPVPFPEGIENLYLGHSPGLTRELLADTAALAAMSRLQLLDMSYGNITNIRSDLLHFFPQLKVLRLEGNKLNCTDLNWLADWMREISPEAYKEIKCFFPDSLRGKFVIDLPSLPKHYYRQKITTTIVPNINKNMQAGINNISINTMNFKNSNSNNNVKNDRIIHSPDFKINANRTIVRNNKEIRDEILDILNFHKSNVSHATEINKTNILNNGNQVKTLLDFRDDQQSIHLKTPKKINLREQTNVYNTNTILVNATDDSQVLTSIKKFPTTVNIELLKETKEIFSSTISTSQSTKNSLRNATDKAIAETFTQESQKLNESIDPAIQEKISQCIAYGNSNGSEYKRNCVNLLKNVPEHLQKYGNLTLIPYDYNSRRIGNETVRIKYKPKFNRTTTSPEDPEPIIEEHMDRTIILSGKVVTLSHVKNSLKRNTWITNGNKINKTNNTKEEEHPTGNNSNSQPINNTNKDLEIRSTETESVRISMERRNDNVSEYQTSRFRAEETTGLSALGFGLLAGVMGITCITLAVVIYSRRRPLIRRPRSTEMMEVQTISAVGELW